MPGFTQEMYAKLDEAIASLRGQEGAVMRTLQAAQEIFGCVTKPIQVRIAEGLNVPLSEVYGVATFYSQFSLNPKGKHRISVCLGTACYVKGSGVILEELEKILDIKNGECTPDGKFSIDACRCVGACGLAPVMLIDDDVYGRMNPNEIEKILAKYE